MNQTNLKSVSFSGRMSGICIVHSIMFITLLLMVGCRGNEQSADDFITVDVTANYPLKEHILQDFVDVEYIPLETTDEFLCQGSIWAVGKNVIVATNFNNDGNIFIYNRKGKALRMINRKGQGSEEYTNYSRIVLDEESGELFVNNDFSKKILVYDLEGNFKRSLPIKSDLSLYEMYNLDKDNLICHDTFRGNTGQSFMIISKQDGSITKEIEIPFKEKKTINVRVDDKEVEGRFYVYAPQTSHPIMPYFNGYILTEYSSDTLYRYLPDHTMKPFIARTPSVESMNPEVFLIPNMLTDRYYFMGAIEKTINFQTTDIVYDKQEKSLSRYRIYNNDYTNKKEVFLSPRRPLNSEIISWQTMESYELVLDYEKGRLKGHLKEIAAKLDPEDNPVIMLMKRKR